MNSYCAGIYIARSPSGCNIGNIPVNILAYADDVVLLSPSLSIVISYFISHLHLLFGCILSTLNKDVMMMMMMMIVERTSIYD